MTDQPHIALSDYLPGRFPGIDCDIDTEDVMIHDLGDGYSLLYKVRAHVPLVKINVGYAKREDIVVEVKEGLKLLKKYDGRMPVPAWLAIFPSEIDVPDVNDLTMSADLKRKYLHNNKTGQRGVAWDRKWGQHTYEANIMYAMGNMKDFSSANQFDTDRDTDSSSDDDSDSDGEMPPAPDILPRRKTKDAADEDAEDPYARRRRFTVMKDIPYSKTVEVVERQRERLQGVSTAFEELYQKYGGNIEGVDEWWSNWLKQLSTHKPPDEEVSDQLRRDKQWLEDILKVVREDQHFRFACNVEQVEEDGESLLGMLHDAIGAYELFRKMLARKLCKDHEIVTDFKPTSRGPLNIDELMTNAGVVFDIYNNSLKGKQGEDLVDWWGQMYSVLKPLAVNPHTFRLLDDKYKCSKEKVWWKDTEGNTEPTRGRILL